jgi:Ca-activated chloride channel homolog
VTPFGIEWHQPLWLLALLAVPLAAAAMVAALRRRRSLARRYADPALMPLRTPARVGLRRAVAALALLLALAVAATALARPYRVETDDRRSGSVVLAIDVSLSMRKTDIPPTRLDAAREAASRFMDEAPDDVRIGLIAFADTADVVVAPTLDRAALRAALDGPRFAEPREGTAIGDAISVGLTALQASGALTPPPATPQESAGRILLLTDGAQSAGQVQPQEGAQRAAGLRVPVYTILLGDDPGRPDQATPAETLSTISAATAGVFAQSTTGPDLERVFADMGRIIAPEPREVELTWIPALGALALLLAAGALWVAATPRREGVAHPPAALR